MVLDELVKQPARSTIISSAHLSDAAYARVPVGETCRFCLMLASRGAVYHSAKTAGKGRKFHGYCDCAVILVTSEADYPDGYDPDELYRQYLNGDFDTPKAKAPTPQAGGSGGGGDDGGDGPPTRRWLALPPDGDVPFSHKGRTLGRPADWQSHPEILASHVAPEDDPDRYFLDDERDTARWLRRRYGIELLSVKERRGAGHQSPDALIPAWGQGLEMKHPRTDSYLTLIDHIVKGSRQGPHVVVRSSSPYQQDLAEQALGEALEQVGATLSSCIIELKGGRCLVWMA